MGKNDLVDLVRLPASVPRRIAQLDGREGEDRLTACGLHMDVRRIVFAGVKEESVWAKAMNRGHADLADGSTGGHHGRVRFTTAYLGNSVVSHG